MFAMPDGHTVLSFFCEIVLLPNFAIYFYTVIMAVMLINRREQNDEADNTDDDNYAAEDYDGVDDDKYGEHNCEMMMMMMMMVMAMVRMVRRRKLMTVTTSLPAPPVASWHSYLAPINLHQRDTTVGSLPRWAEDLGFMQLQA